MDCGEILITGSGGHRLAASSDMLEGYELELSPQQIHLKADSTWGVTWPNYSKQLICEALPRQVHIVDQPNSLGVG